MRQKMRNWQNFITCNVPTAIRGKVLHWANSIINFITCNSLTKLSEKVSNWAYSIECTNYQQESEKRYSTVQYSAIQLSTVQYSTVQ